MNQDQARRWAEEVLELADDYAEVRHTKGDRSYNTETAAKREAIAAALVKLMQWQEPVAEFGDTFIFNLRKQPNGERWPVGTKLYTHPAPSQLSKDPELLELAIQARGRAEARKDEPIDQWASDLVESVNAPSQQEERKPLGKLNQQGSGEGVQTELEEISRIAVGEKQISEYEAHHSFIRWDARDKQWAERVAELERVLGVARAKFTSAMCCHPNAVLTLLCEGREVIDAARSKEKQQ